MAKKWKHLNLLVAVVGLERAPLVGAPETDIGPRQTQGPVRIEISSCQSQIIHFGRVQGLRIADILIFDIAIEQSGLVEIPDGTENLHRQPSQVAQGICTLVLFGGKVLDLADQVTVTHLHYQVRHLLSLKCRHF